VVLDVVWSRNAGAEEQIVERSAIASIPEPQAPSPFDRDRIARQVIKLSKRRTVRRVEDVDGPITKIADQQIIAEWTEAGRRQGHSPWRVERAVGNQSTHQRAVAIEHIDEAVARAGDIIVLRRILLRIGDVKLAADVLDPEWRISRRQIWINEPLCHAQRQTVTGMAVAVALG